MSVPSLSIHCWETANRGKIFRTTNSGATWIPYNVGVGRNLYDIFFVDKLNGWAVGASGTIVASTDGGNSWFGHYPI